MKNLLRKFIKKNNKKIQFQLGEASNLKELGEGGNGLVYSGILNEQEVAIKFLVEDGNRKLTRFKAEYFNINLIKRDKSIVSYIDYDEINVESHTFPCIIMKKYNGSLKSINKDIEINENELFKFFKFLINTVNLIHKQGIIHRDLKPENILVNEGEYVLSDFGIASYNEEMFSYKPETTDKERLGNYNFSAPEQAYGGATAKATMDIYSIGQLCQWFVFNRTHKGTNRKHFGEILENNDNIQILDSIINKCLANNPDDRYKSIDEIIEDYDLKKRAKKKVDPFDEMLLLNEAMRATEPESYCNIKCIEDNSILNDLITNIKSKNFKEELWFNTGNSNNYITRLEYLDENRILLNQRELFVEKLWLYSGSNLYDDVLIIEAKTEDIEYYKIDGEDMSHVTIINGEYFAKPEIVESGYIRIDGKVIKTSEVKCDYRDRLNHTKYYFIGTVWSCSIISKNDDILEEFQKNDANKDEIMKLIKNIRKHKHEDVYMQL